MKILHTSDWHIGKRLMGRERLSEQAAALAREAGAPYLAVYEAAMQAYRERKKEE